MPFKSEAQRRYMHANHPQIAAKWESEFPNQGKLPEHVAGSKSASNKTKKQQDFKQRYAKAIGLISIILSLTLASTTKAITLLWDSPQGGTTIDMYYIYGSSTLSNFTIIGSSTNLSWSTNMQPQKMFFYVTASNFWGESIPSNIINTPIPITNNITTLKITKP